MRGLAQPAGLWIEAASCLARWLAPCAPLPKSVV
jgi:hypothetical protein